MATGLVGTDIADGVVGLDIVHRVCHLPLLLLLFLRLGRRLLDVHVRRAVRHQTGVLNNSNEDYEERCKAIDLPGFVRQQ